jgi:hypothetical protein
MYDSGQDIEDGGGHGYHDIDPNSVFQVTKKSSLFYFDLQILLAQDNEDGGSHDMQYKVCFLDEHYIYFERSLVRIRSF